MDVAKNTIRVLTDGPLAVHANLELVGEGPRIRAALCRCGATKRAPHCDSSHGQCGFRATGEPARRPDTFAGPCDGAVRITPAPGGPLVVEGRVEVLTGAGELVARADGCALCRCGRSQDQPFCDGSHAAGA